MSILTIGKDERFNNYIPSSHIDKVKALSDAKNQGDNLTHSNKGLDSSHGQARQKREAIQDKLNIKALETQTEKDYFYSLLEDSF